MGAPRDLRFSDGHLSENEAKRDNIERKGNQGGKLPRGLGGFNALWGCVKQKKMGGGKKILTEHRQQIKNSHRQGSIY